VPCVADLVDFLDNGLEISVFRVIFGKWLGAEGHGDSGS